MTASENTAPATISVHAPFFIFMTLFIDSMGIGLIMPVLPDLIEELTKLSTSEAARWGGYLGAVYALMQFIFSPTLGNLSDRFGRRPILLISMIALSINYLFMALAASIVILFIGRILSGIAAATFSAAYAYMADITSAEKRTQNFGLLGAAFGLGFVVGPAIGGVLGELDTRAPFYAAAFLSFLNFLYGAFIIPESLAPEKRRKFEWKRSNPFGAFRQMAKMPKVYWFFITMFFFNLAHFVYPAVWSFYTKKAFAWTNFEIGISLAVVGITFAIVQGGLIRLILPRLGESRTAILGFTTSILSLIIIAFITEGWMVYVFIPLTGFGALVTPAMGGIMSNLVSEDTQGELQGALASISGLTLIFSPYIMTGLFSYFSADSSPIYFPGAPFLLAAILMAIALIPFFTGLAKNQLINK